MTTDITFVSRYELRVKLVRDVLQEDTKLTDTACQALAVRLPRTVDTILEKTTQMPRGLGVRSADRQGLVPWHSLI